MERCFQPPGPLCAFLYWTQRQAIVAVTAGGELSTYVQARERAGREDAQNHALFPPPTLFNRTTG